MVKWENLCYVLFTTIKNEAELKRKEAGIRSCPDLETLWWFSAAFGIPSCLWPWLRRPCVVCPGTFHGSFPLPALARRAGFPSCSCTASSKSCLARHLPCLSFCLTSPPPNLPPWPQTPVFPQHPKFHCQRHHPSLSTPRPAAVPS